MDYDNLESMIWDYKILRSCIKHYQKRFKCDKQVAEDYIKTHLNEYMRKHYENIYLPQINKELEYGGKEDG